MRYYLIKHVSRVTTYDADFYCKYLLQCLKEIPDVEPIVIDFSFDINDLHITKIDGIEYYAIPVQSNPNMIELYAYGIVSILADFLPKREPFVFHFNNSQFYDLARLLKANYPNCFLICAVHNLGWCQTLNGNVTRFRNIVHHNICSKKNEYGIKSDYNKEKRFFSICNRIITISSFAQNLLKTDYGVPTEKLSVVYNGIDVQELCKVFHYQPEISCREILFIGELENTKGAEYLIKAFRMLLQNDINAHLTLVGDGNIHQYLSLCDGIWDKITFTGKINNKQLLRLFRKTTIAVQPSFNEQCCYTAIEIMGHGIPLIATDTTGLREMMEYTPEYMIKIKEVDFNDEEFIKELSDKMRSLLNNTDSRKKVSEKQMYMLRERYTFEQMRKSMSKICSTVTSQVSLSNTFYPHLDSKMINLINAYMDIEEDFKGLAGIGCYMWHRICELNRQENKAAISISYMLQENLVYYIDWLHYTLNNKKNTYGNILNDGALLYILYQLLENGFYKTKVQSIINMLPTTGYQEQMKKFALSVKDNKQIIINNALNIYNTYYHI